jgi:hypothetical protein
MRLRGSDENKLRALLCTKANLTTEINTGYTDLSIQNLALIELFDPFKSVLSSVSVVRFRFFVQSGALPMIMLFLFWPLLRFDHYRQIAIARIREPQLDSSFFIQRDHCGRVHFSQHPSGWKRHIVQWTP